jgi:hypothetical protein
MNLSNHRIPKRLDDPLVSFPHKRESSFACRKTLGPRFRGDDTAFTSTAGLLRLTLGLRFRGDDTAGCRGLFS